MTLNSSIIPSRRQRNTPPSVIETADDSIDALLNPKGERYEESNVQRPILAMKLNMIIAVSAVALVGNYLWQSHDLRLGPYEYQASTPAPLSNHAHSGARQLALNGANKKCASFGKQIGEFDLQSRQPGDPASETASVTFVCK